MLSPVSESVTCDQVTANLNGRCKYFRDIIWIKKICACSCILQLVSQSLHELSDFIEKDMFKTRTKGMEGMVLFQKYLMTEIHRWNLLFLFFFRS